jgi:hypothetical protein
MSWRPALVALALLGGPACARAAAPLYDPVILNIGLNCQWQQSCMSHQQRAMKHALKYMEKYHPPLWRIAQCNRNASRYMQRTDWIGFNNCVRNEALAYRPSPPPVAKKAKRHRHTKRHHHHRR